jgi:hypothetical protein
MFTDPPFARVGLREGEAERQGVITRVARLPMDAVLGAQATDRTQGFMKALVADSDDRILGFAMIGTAAGEVMAAVHEPTGPRPADPRAGMYSMVGHQAATVQTIALGADRDGRLTGIRHDSVNPTSVFDDYVEYAAMVSRHLWGASGGIATSHRVVYVNRNSPVVLRASAK